MERTSEIKPITFTTKGELWEQFAEEQQATVRHSVRTAERAEKMAHALGWDERRIALTKEAARWHDIGKIYPEQLPPFNSSMKFNKEQSHAMMKHCTLGARDLSTLGFPQEVVATALLHHSIGSEEFLQQPADTQEMIILIAMVDIDDAILGEVRPYQTEVLTEEHVALEWQEKLGEYITPALRTAFQHMSSEQPTEPSPSV